VAYAQEMGSQDLLASGQTQTSKTPLRSSARGVRAYHGLPPHYNQYCHTVEADMSVRRAVTHFDNVQTVGGAATTTTQLNVKINQRCKNLQTCRINQQKLCCFPSDPTHRRALIKHTPWPKLVIIKGRLPVCHMLFLNRTTQ